MKMVSFICPGKADSVKKQRWPKHIQKHLIETKKFI